MTGQQIERLDSAIEADPIRNELRARAEEFMGYGAVSGTVGSGDEIGRGDNIGLVPETGTSPVAVSEATLHTQTKNVRSEQTIKGHNFSYPTVRAIRAA